MSEEKLIDLLKDQRRLDDITQMAKVIEITEQIARDAHCGYPSPRMMATDLYEKGYRKQSEGEWVAKSLTSTSTRGRTIKYSTYKCSVCGTWNGRHKQKYCHECGAKMKGGEG